MSQRTTNLSSLDFHECSGCGGRLDPSDQVIAWWPIHPAWVPGSSKLAFIHVSCAARVPSFDVLRDRTLAQVLAEVGS